MPQSQTPSRRPSLFQQFFTFDRVLRILHLLVFIYAAAILALSAKPAQGFDLFADKDFLFSFAVAAPLLLGSGMVCLALLTDNFCGTAIFFCTLLPLVCAVLPFWVSRSMPIYVLLFFLGLLYFVTNIFLVMYLLKLPEEQKQK